MEEELTILVRLKAEGQRQLDRFKNSLKSFGGIGKTVTRALGRAAKGFVSVGRAALRAATSMKALVGAFLAFLAARGAVRVLTNTAAQLDEIAKNAGFAGISVENFSKLLLATRFGGVQITELRQGFRFLQTEVAKGSEAFERLGVTLRDKNTGEFRDAFNIFVETAEAVKDIDNNVEQTQAALEVFGSEVGARLLPLIRSGLADTLQEAERLGFVFDQRATTAAENFNDALTRLGAAFTGLRSRALTPVFERLAEIINGLALAIGRLGRSDEFRKAMKDFVETLTNFADRFLSTIKAVIDNFGALTKTIGPFFTESIPAFLTGIQSAFFDTIDAIALKIETTGAETLRVLELSTLERLDSLASILPDTLASPATQTNIQERMAEIQGQRAMSGTGVIDTSEARGTLSRGLGEAFSVLGDSDLAKQLREINEIGKEGGLISTMISNGSELMAGFMDSLGGEEAVEKQQNAKKLLGQIFGENGMLNQDQFDVLQNGFAAFGQSASNAFAQVIDGSLSVKEAFAQVVRGIISNIISLAAQMAVIIPLAFLFNALVPGAGASVAANVAQISASLAGAGSLLSNFLTFGGPAAGIDIDPNAQLGPNPGGAAGGSTGGDGSASFGATPGVPSGGGLSGQGLNRGGGGGNTTVISINAVDDQSVSRLFQRNSKALGDAIVSEKQVNLNFRRNLRS